MTSETLDDHAYIPAALAAAEPTWVTNLLAKLQHHDANVNALRFEVATLRAGVQALRGEFATLRTDFSESKNTNTGAENISTVTTATGGLPTNTGTETAAATLSDLALEVARLRRRADELPVLLTNSCAHPNTQLYNPTTYRPSPETLLPSDGSLPEALVPPNPVNRDELLLFTGKRYSSITDTPGSSFFHGSKLNFIFYNI